MMHSTFVILYIRLWLMMMVVVIFEAEVYEDVVL